LPLGCGTIEPEMQRPASFKECCKFKFERKAHEP
jgi:hypothetical protein